MRPPQFGVDCNTPLLPVENHADIVAVTSDRLLVDEQQSIDRNVFDEDALIARGTG